MLTLSIHPPAATLRSWSTSVRGRIVIHVAAAMTPQDHDLMLLQEIRALFPTEPALGTVIGSLHLLAVRPLNEAWTHGRIYFNQNDLLVNDLTQHGVHLRQAAQAK